MDDLSLELPPRQLKRTATVQNSQLEDMDLSSDLYRSISASSRTQQQIDYDSNAHDNLHDEGGTYDQGPYTYDPVSAALERDAERFGWTQTQAPLGRVANSVDDKDDGDDYDLDHGIEPPSDNEDDVVMLPKPARAISQELGDLSDPPAGALEEPLPAAGAANEPGEPEAADGALTEVASEQDPPSDSPPSSPPTLRPSQTSTVVPTQMSPRHATQRVKFEVKEYSPPTSPPAPREKAVPAPISPSQKPAEQGRLGSVIRPRTQEFQFSSSPLPFPPWSSPERGRWAGMETQSLRENGNEAGKAREALNNLTDFSLPPPPPLMSSSVPRSD